MGLGSPAPPTLWAATTTLSLHLPSLAPCADSGAVPGEDGGWPGQGLGCGSRDLGWQQGGSEACEALGSVTWGHPWKSPPAGPHTGLLPNGVGLTKGPAAPRERPVVQDERGGAAAIRPRASLQARAKRTETGSRLLPLWKGRYYEQTVPARMRDSC